MTGEERRVARQGARWFGGASVALAAVAALTAYTGSPWEAVAWGGVAALSAAASALLRTMARAAP